MKFPCLYRLLCGCSNHSLELGWWPSLDC